MRSSAIGSSGTAGLLRRRAKPGRSQLDAGEVDEWLGARLTAGRAHGPSTRCRQGVWSPGETQSVSVGRGLNSGKLSVTAWATSSTLWFVFLARLRSSANA